MSILSYEMGKETARALLSADLCQYARGSEAYLDFHDGYRDEQSLMLLGTDEVSEEGWEEFPDPDLELTSQWLM